MIKTSLDFFLQESGLSATLGRNLTVFASYDPWVMNLIFSLIVAAATEVTSNTAMATLLMPILATVVSFSSSFLYYGELEHFQVR